MKPRSSRGALAAGLIVLLLTLSAGTTAALGGLPLDAIEGPRAPLPLESATRPAPGKVPSAIAPMPTPQEPSGDAAMDVPPALASVEWGPGGDPLEGLVSGLGQGALRDTASLSRSLGHYFHAAGYDVPSPSIFPAGQPAQGTKFNQFSENDTLNFAYKIGDVNGDGWEDMLLNVYCVEFFCRYQGANAATVPPALGTDTWCGTPHRVFALSGYNGTVLWERDLGHQRVGLFNFRLPTDPPCPIHFVVGTVPDNVTHRQAILMYSITLTPISNEVLSDKTPFGFILFHELYLLSPDQGRVVWSKPVTGLIVAECDKTTIFQPCTLGNNRIIHARDLVLNPYLQIPPDRGARIIDNQTTPTLGVQGIGFNFTLLRHCSTSFPLPCPAPPGQTMDSFVTENYQPAEWLARYHPLTGKQEWRANTFQPDLAGSKSVVPRLVQSPPLSPTFVCWSGVWSYSGYAPWGGATRDNCPGYTTGLNDPAYLGAQGSDVGVAMNQYWRHRPCCFDLTGDNIPDYAYTTMEWDAYDLLPMEAPKFLDSRLVVFDGASGKQLYAHQLAKDVQRFVDEDYALFGAHAYHVQQEVLGDANGDGADDLLLHRTYWKENFTQVVSVHDGRTGNELWRHTTPYRVATLVLGDTSKDGGNDILFLEWAGWEYARFTTYDLANVTRTNLIVREGSDGSEIWRTETFNAPIDLYMQYHLFRQWGIPDVNGDGVGDVLTDDPVFLPDLTVVHRLRYHDGVDGTVFFDFDSVGIFATVVYAGDPTGDGVDDFVLLSGDAPDLWTTVFNGTSGLPEWSRRVLAPRVAEYLIAVPNLSILPMTTPNGTAMLTNLQMFFQTTRIIFGSFFQPVQSFYPQMALFSNTGEILFGYPKFWDEEIYVQVDGATPASAAFRLASEEATRPKGATGLAINYPGMTVGTALTTVASIGAGFLVALWRFRP